MSNRTFEPIVNCDTYTSGYSLIIGTLVYWETHRFWHSFTHLIENLWSSYDFPRRGCNQKECSHREWKVLPPSSTVPLLVAIENYQSARWNRLPEFFFVHPFILIGFRSGFAPGDTVALISDWLEVAWWSLIFHRCSNLGEEICRTSKRSAHLIKSGVSPAPCETVIQT